MNFGDYNSESTLNFPYAGILSRKKEILLERIYVLQSKLKFKKNNYDKIKKELRIITMNYPAIKYKKVRNDKERIQFTKKFKYQ